MRLPKFVIGFLLLAVSAFAADVDGNNISFSVTIDIGMPLKLTYAGVVSGNELKVKGDAAGMPFEFVLKKA